MLGFANLFLARLAVRRRERRVLTEGGGPLSFDFVGALTYAWLATVAAWIGFTGLVLFGWTSLPGRILFCGGVVICFEFMRRLPQKLPRWPTWADPALRTLQLVFAVLGVIAVLLLVINPQT